MRRPPRQLIAAVAVACVLVISGVATGQPAGLVGFQSLPEDQDPQPIPPPDFESTERLVLAEADAVLRNGTVRPDPTASTSHSFAALEAAYRGHAVRAEMQRANGSQEELAIVSDELDRLRAQIARLLDRERRLRVDMARGEMSGDEFLRELGYLQLRAERIDAELESLAAAIRSVTAPVTQNDAQRLRGEVSQAQLEVRTMQGPITDRVARSMLTERDPVDSVSMRVAGSGYVLATIDGGLFVRESLAADNRERGAGTGYSDIDEARERTASLYPWTVAEAVESEDIPRGEIYASTINHPHGTTGIFIDSATELPFRDSHELDLFSLPTREAATEVRGELSIVVERTYPGGPTQVVVEENGEAVADASIRVGGRDVGSTGSDGATWFVAPSDAFEVTVVTQDGAITLPVRMGE